jgi:esterase
VRVIVVFSCGLTGENHHDWRPDMDYRDMVRDVVYFLDSHKIDRAVLVGHSMGGKVAQACALLQPDRVAGLVVLDIAPVAYTRDEPHWAAVEAIIQTLSRVPVGAGITKQHVDKQLRATIPDPALRAFVLTNLEVTKTDCRWKIHLQAIAAQLNHLAGFDIPSEYTYPGDTFFIHGGQSRFVRHSYMDKIQQYFPNHLLTTIKGAGHWLHAEAPDDTTALLKRYLDR